MRAAAAATPPAYRSHVEVEDPVNMGAAPKPAGTIEGDNLVAVALTANGQSPVPTGWTQLARENMTSIDVAVLTKAVGASEPATYDFSGGDGTEHLVLATFKDGGAITLLEAGTETNSGFTADAPGTVAPAGSGNLIIRVCAGRLDTLTTFVSVSGSRTLHVNESLFYDARTVIGIATDDSLVDNPITPGAATFTLDEQWDEGGIAYTLRLSAS